MLKQSGYWGIPETCPHLYKHLDIKRMSDIAGRTDLYKDLLLLKLNIRFEGELEQKIPDRLYDHNEYLEFIG